MLSPNRMKFRKQQRHLLYPTGVATTGNKISFGEYGLVAVELGMISSRQIEAARIAMTRKIKRSGQVWIRLFPDRTYTSKPAETRMGKGKGGVDKWVAPVKIGTMMFEMAGVSPELAKEAMMLAAAKLPVKAKFIIRRDLA